MSGVFRHMSVDDQIKRIQNKLSAAQKKDRFFKVFGAKSHQYVTSNPVSSDAVKQFEAKYKVCLPNDFVQFVTDRDSKKSNRIS